MPPPQTVLDLTSEFEQRPDDVRGRVPILRGLSAVYSKIEADGDTDRLGRFTAACDAMAAASGEERERYESFIYAMYRRDLRIVGESN